MSNYCFWTNQQNCLIFLQGTIMTISWIWKKWSQSEVINIFPHQQESHKGLLLGPLLVLVSPCFRENVNVTCKIWSFLCSLDNNTSKKRNCFLFWKFKFQNGAHLKKGLFLTYFSHFLVTREKLQKFLQHISHSRTYMYFAHSIDFYRHTNFEKIRIYQVWFLFGEIPGADSYSRHFGTINE